ncbi:MFS transporter [Lentzea sp. NPDC005914]|uniref:MFS transporter n=1 Tax=Lentzea sp. NPDC005914 TaxID=3154572 RepID=UPI0033C6D67E
MERSTSGTTLGTALPRYLAAAVLVRLADEGARVALVLLALEKVSSPALGGQLVAALMVPHVVAAPLVGALADRVRRRRLFHAIALVLYGVALAGCALLVGRTPAAVPLLVAVLGGCVAPLVTGGLTSLLGDLVDARRLQRAFALDSTSYNLAGICGPALVAALAVVSGAVIATLSLAVAAVAAGVLLAGLPLADRQDTPTGRPDLTGGVRVLWRSRPLRAVTLASSVGQIGIGALPLAATALAVHNQGDAAVGGVLVSAFAVGALAGSLSYAKKPLGASRPTLVILIGLFATAVPFAVVSLVSNTMSAAVLFAAAGFFTGPTFSALLAIRDREAPAEVRVQVFTLGAGLKSAAAAVGAVVAGALSNSAPLVLGVAICHALAALCGAVVLRRR